MLPVSLVEQELRSECKNVQGLDATDLHKQAAPRRNCMHQILRLTSNDRYHLMLTYRPLLASQQKGVYAVGKSCN